MENAKSSKPSVKVSDEYMRDLFKTVLPKVSPSACPPIQVLVYTAQQILLPYHCWDLTFELLEILAQIEVLRKRAVEEAKHAIVWDTYIRNQNLHKTSAEAFTKPELKAAKRLASDEASANARATYIQSVLHIKREHINHLLQTQQHAAIADAVTLHFSDLKSRVDRLCLSDASPEERQDYVAEVQKCYEHLELVQEWEERREAKWKETIPGLQSELLYGETELISYRSDYSRKFRPTFEWDGVVNIVMRWMAKVQSMIDELQALFISSPRRVIDTKNDSLRSVPVKAEPVSPTNTKA